MRARLALTMFALAAIGWLGCGSGSDSPSGPRTSRVGQQPVAAAQNTCEEDFLLALSPVLQQWQTALEDSQGTDFLPDPPVYSEGADPAGYLDLLSPVLAVWEDSIDTWRGGDILDTPPVFDDTTMVSEYLLELSPVLGQWQSALEEELGGSFLDNPPVFTEDTTAPVINCPGDTTIECTSEGGATFEFEVTASDNCDPNPAVSCDPPSGSPFPFGATLVTCTAEDSAGNTSQCMFTVTVVDTTPPTITCPPDTTLECGGPNGAVLEYTTIVSDNCDPAPAVDCDWPSGSSFPMGETVVTCAATDAAGNRSECSFRVTVMDRTPPTIHSVSATPDRLWAPNHKMVDIAITVEAEDLCGGVTAWVTDVTSNEDVNGLGDGNTEPDWSITADLGLQLRAERSGLGSGRVYTIHVRCTDDAGNTVERTVDVTVPHDQGP